MISFGGLSFNWFLLLFIGIGFFYALRAGLGYVNVARDAKADYDYKLAQDMVDKRLSEMQYIKIYRRVHNPRSAAYVAATIFAIFIITPVTMAIFESVYNMIYNLSGQSRVIEPGFLVWQFFIFFFVLLNCAAIAYFMARHYHRYTPGSFLAEIEAEIEKSLAQKITNA